MIRTIFNHLPAACRCMALVAAIVVGAALQGCTSNDGNIGPWFGSWSLTGMTADGTVPADFTPGATVWEFQADVVHITRRADHSTLDRSSWGTWSESSDLLILDFTHSQTGVAPGTGDYSAPTWLGLPANAVSELTIVSHPGRQMRLSFNSPEGVTYQYTLEKTW